MALKKISFYPGDIPAKPGVYIYRDSFGTVIYVGKAANLRKRMSQYFQPSRETRADPKLRSLINSIDTWECLTVRSERDRIGGGDNYTQAMKYLEIKNVLDKYYVDDVNEEAVSSAAFDAMVTGLGDKWSDYMSPSDYEAYKLYSSNQYTGLGITMDKDAETGGFVVQGVTEDSPAAKAGIEVGEIILAVAGQDITSLTIGDAHSFINSNLSASVSVKLLNLEGKESTVNVDCSANYTNPVSYKMLEGRRP